ncbi:MAG: DNA primase [Chloroflexi bacterium]|nr:MAG: DNA primase [Chloroflexota bacterium]TME18712.1 MAG: DNA primase [Chloroflexota bacterium]
MPGGDDAKEQIRTRADLVEIVREHVRLRQVGGQFTGLCPFHTEKTPSFRVTPQTQTWHCFGCDRGGDIFTFVELIEKIDFRGALEMLAERTGVELVKEAPGTRERSQLRKRILELNRLAAQYYEYVLHSTEVGRPGLEILAKRGVSPETARRFQLGFAPPGGQSLQQFLSSRKHSLPDADQAGLVRRGRDFFKNRLIIPIRDERGQTVAFVGRDATGTDDRKYVNSPDTPAFSKSRVLFALDLAKEEIGRRGHAVLVEGQFDVIVAHQFGVANAIATSGTALTEEQVKLLKRFTEEVILAFDGDPAGKAAAYRAIETCSAAGLRTRVASLGEAKDPDEFLRAGGDWSLAAAAAPPEWEFWIRETIAGLNPTRPRDLQVGLEKVYGVLLKIAEPAVREAYRVKAAEWLGIDQRLMRRNGHPAPAQPGGLEPARPGKKLSVGQHILSVIAVRPEALDRVESSALPDDFNEEDRRTFGLMRQTLQAGGLDALRDRLGSFGEQEQDLIRRAWASPPPRTDDEFVAELTWRLRLESLQTRLGDVRRRLGEAEQRGDRDQVALLEMEDRRLAREVQAFKTRKDRERS